MPLDPLTQRYHDAYQNLAAQLNPDQAITARARCWTACSFGLAAEEQDPGCTNKSAAWWRIELARWEDANPIYRGAQHANA